MWAGKNFKQEMLCQSNLCHNTLKFPGVIVGINLLHDVWKLEEKWIKAFYQKFQSALKSWMYTTKHKFKKPNPNLLLPAQRLKWMFFIYFSSLWVALLSESYSSTNRLEEWTFELGTSVKRKEFVLFLCEHLHELCTISDMVEIEEGSSSILQ